MSILIRVLLALFLTIQFAHGASLPQSLNQVLTGLPIVHNGTCHFKADNSDPEVRCVVLDGGEVWFALIINGQHVIRVRVIKQDNPDQQEDIWTDPDSII
jgi:hypothetical protein